MKLCDVNVLVNAHRPENRGHEFYREWLLAVVEGEDAFFFSEWVLAGFMRIVTHPRVYRTPTPISIAIEYTEGIRSRPNAVPVTPGGRHWRIFTDLCHRCAAAGNLVPDAYLAALAIEAGAEWVTSDRDFIRFEPELDLRLLRPPAS